MQKKKNPKAFGRHTVEGAIQSALFTLYMYMHMCVQINIIILEIKYNFKSWSIQMIKVKRNC